MLRCLVVGSTALFIASLAAVTAGCDDAPAPPADLVTPATRESEEPQAPTTQELLSGPRKVLALGVLPLTARVPESWSISDLGNGSIKLLEGPAPAGLVQVQFAARPFVAGDKLEGILNRARKEKIDKADTVKVLDVKPMPGTAGVQVMERQSTGKTLPPVPLDTEGKALSKPETLYSWTITYFIPQADGFEAYELNFVGLTAEQFQADRTLLREIVDSVEYTGAPTTAPAGG